MGRSKVIYNTVVKLWSLGRVANWLGDKWPMSALLRPLFAPEDNHIIIIPVQEVVRGVGSAVLPYILLTPLVERASARFIMSGCMCRRGWDCQTHPHNIGCLFLGDGAAEINSSMGRLVNVDKALAHVRQAMEVGLVPLIAHQKFDAYVLGIPYRRMLNVCFCCECCCTVRQSLRLGPPVFWDAVIRLPGLTMVVGQDCVGCGICLDVCPVKAISLNNGRACISEQCKGCGRCALVCPVEVIALRLDDDVDVLGCFMACIERRTDIGLVRG